MASSTTKLQTRYLVSPEWLADRIGRPDVEVLDARLPDIYADNHLPDALNLPLPALTTIRDGVPEMLLGPSKFEACLGALGIRESDTLVLYDDMWGLPASRVLWALERYGHDDVRVLDGGFDRWKREGRPLTTNAPTPEPATYRATAIDDREASHAWLLTHVNDPDVVVVDARTPREYADGHVPGAVNWDWMNSVPADNRSPVRPETELRPEFESLGITPDKEIVVYCRSGARSAHTYFTLRHLGYPRVRNYDGSWLAWMVQGGTP